ncbi:MAG: hypothetical protein HZA17_03230 [Nitrospirae bacterium]|nr:hypothetical protein [Nitrospirota bacterium]
MSVTCISFSIARRLSSGRAQGLKALLLIACVTLFVSCGSCDNAKTSASGLTVRVLSYLRAPVPNVSIVLGDNNGSLISVAETNAAGEVHFDAPPTDATVTIAWQDTGGGARSLISFYDVNTPFVVVAGKVPFSPLDSKNILGSATIKANNTIGAAHWALSGGSFPYMPLPTSPVTPVTVTITDKDLQNDGKVSFVVIGFDLQGNPVGYGTLLDQEFTDGMSLNLAIDKTDFLTARSTILNFPGSTANLSGTVSLQRKGASLVSIQSKSVTDKGRNIYLKYIPDFADKVTTEISNSAGGVLYSLGLFSETVSDLAFDFADALPAPSNVKITDAGTDKATISWGGIDTESDAVHIFASPKDADVPSFYEIYAPPWRNSVILPHLPDSLAAFRPTGFKSITVNNYDYDFISGYKEFIDKKMQGNSWTWPASGSYRRTAPGVPVPSKPK